MSQWGSYRYLEIDFLIVNKKVAAPVSVDLWTSDTNQLSYQYTPCYDNVNY